MQYLCYVQLIGGLILLILGGNYLVEASSDVARKFKMSTLLIGLTIVSFGTSAPELLVSTSAALSGHTDMALGNVVGSNIANISFIGALTALLLPFFVSVKSIKVDGMVMLLFSVLLFLACWDGELSRVEGIVAVLLLILYVVWSLYDSKKSGAKEEFESPKHSLLLNIVILLASFAALAFGSDMLVKGASEIALRWGVEERVISIVIVAVGTSLPELAASIASVYKKEVGITIGNIIGSNIFNIGAVLGITTSISPIHVSFENFKSDLIWFLLFSVILIIGMLNVRKNLSDLVKTHKITALWNCQNGYVGRLWGFLTLAAYAVYIYLLL